MGAVKTEKKEFSFSNKRKKQRVREVEGNKKQNGINIIMGSLIEFVSTLSPAPAAEGNPW